VAFSASEADSQHAAIYVAAKHAIKGLKSMRLRYHLLNAFSRLLRLAQEGEHQCHHHHHRRGEETTSSDFITKHSKYGVATEVKDENDS